MTRHTLVGSAYAWPAAALFLVLAVVAGIRAPTLQSAEGINGAIASAAPLLLATLALTVTAIAGSGVDLSIGPAVIFVNVCLVRILFDRANEDPATTIALAIGLGVGIQLILVGIIVLARIDPIIVTLAAFLTLSGLDLVIMPQPQGQAPEWLVGWGSAISGLRPLPLLLVLTLVVWTLLMATTLFRNVRFAGADQRTAFVSGMNVTGARVAGHVLAGVLTGLAGLAYTGVIGSGNPTQGSAITLTAVTALVLGGTSLAGGRGGALGSVFGALSVSMVSITLTTFDFGTYSSFVTQLAYGAILVAALLLGVRIPDLLKRRTEGAVA